jgi:hypothetical protein
MSSTLLNPTLPPLEVEVDERAARRALMTQIARLEADSAALRLPSGAPTEAGRAEPAPARRATPRLLSLAELEDARDRLADRIRTAQHAAGERAYHQEQARILREEMLLDPERYRFVRVTNADIGEPGCLDWHVRPRFGLLGMLMRWWRVHISSGCP